MGGTFNEKGCKMQANPGEPFHPYTDINFNSPYNPPFNPPNSYKTLPKPTLRTILHTYSAYRVPDRHFSSIHTIFEEFLPI